MDKLTITIKTGNDAFGEDWNYEVARMLRGLADKLEDHQEPSKLLDINGNVVGDISYNE